MFNITSCDIVLFYLQIKDLLVEVYNFYLVYNYIRAFYLFERLLKKTCTIALLKVLPVWSSNIFASFWQFVDSITKELRRLDGQECTKPVFNTLFWCEPYTGSILHHRSQSDAKMAYFCCIQVAFLTCKILSQWLQFIWHHWVPCFWMYPAAFKRFKTAA